MDRVYLFLYLLASSLAVFHVCSAKGTEMSSNQQSRAPRYGVPCQTLRRVLGSFPLLRERNEHDAHESILVAPRGSWPAPVRRVAFPWKRKEEVEETTPQANEGTLQPGAKLSFGEAMLAGSLSRSISQVSLQPANVLKTLLQGQDSSRQLSKLSLRMLTRGAGAQFLLALPHGALNFAVLETIREHSSQLLPQEIRDRAGPLLDFASSAVSTLICSAVSTPQMVLTDRIMAGVYPNLVHGVRDIMNIQGAGGFYVGWGANVAHKIPSYGLTWVFYQQLKSLHSRVTQRPPTYTENFLIGGVAAGATVCIMIPLDTTKTRIVTQTVQAGVEPYRGIISTLGRVAQEEGVGALYRSLLPRLVSVMPMMGLQFGIYEALKNELLKRRKLAETQKRLTWVWAKHRASA